LGFVRSVELGVKADGDAEREEGMAWMKIDQVWHLLLLLAVAFPMLLPASTRSCYCLFPDHVP
jgi:hypothetical protein